MTDHPDDLVISRLLAVPRAKVWRAWAEPERLAQWWAPNPWKTDVKAFEFRAGGAFHTYMTGPDGGESDNPGCFLEVTPMERIITTSTLTGGWRPATPWLAITAVITLADEAGGTRYVARVMHKDDADRRQHEEMGFFDGWGTCITQLEDYAKGL